MVGYQVAHQIAVDLHPERIVIVSLAEDDVDHAVEGLRALAPAGVEIIGEWGDVFVREEFSRDRPQGPHRGPRHRERAFEDMLGPIDGAYERSRLATPHHQLPARCGGGCHQHRHRHLLPGRLHVGDHRRARRRGDAGRARRCPPSVMADDIETLILSLTIPQLIRHITILLRALREAGTRMYLKVGTSGTGGMGLDIPFTHSEDRPSARLLTKNAVAFAHTGLLFLMARTDGPLVKEIKPSTLIGYSDLGYRTITETRRERPVLRSPLRDARCDAGLATRHRTGSREASICNCPSSTPERTASSPRVSSRW